MIGVILSEKKKQSVPMCFGRSEEGKEKVARRKFDFEGTKEGR